MCMISGYKIVYRSWTQDMCMVVENKICMVFGQEIVYGHEICVLYSI